MRPYWRQFRCGRAATCRRMISACCSPPRWRTTFTSNRRRNTSALPREARSADALDGIARDCGLGEADRRSIHLLVMATEPNSRSDIAAAIAKPDGGTALPPLLAPLNGDAGLLRLAGLLSDADLLSSAGLTRAWARVQGQRLAHENRMPIGRAEWQHFLNAIVGPGFLSRGGRHFAANLARIRTSRALAAAP